MLNGIDPIIIFQFTKITQKEADTLAKIPLVNKIVAKIGLPPIPIYLSEKLTGLYIDSEDKNIDIETTTETLADGEDPIVTQKAINSTVRINMIASRNSIGLTLLTAVADLIVPKVTSREYAITYLHGPITVFGGLLHSFSVTQNLENDLMNISLELSKTTTKTEKKPGPPEVTPVNDAQTLQGGIAGEPPTTILKAGGDPITKGPAASASSLPSQPPISIGPR